jgi:rare lipoprotein A (peptidoglycan hydrolase)
MTIRFFQNKVLYLLVVFLCILSLGSVSALLGYLSAGAISSGYVGGIGSAQAYQPAPPNAGMKVIASWYGRGHHNRRTSSGQRFDMYKNTLAHRKLPLGTKVRLLNPDNGKYAEGIVNDRGPYIKGRDVDLSYSMARQLGFVKKGIKRLYMETMWRPLSDSGKGEGGGFDRFHANILSFQGSNKGYDQQMRGFFRETSVGICSRL